MVDQLRLRRATIADVPDVVALLNRESHHFTGDTDLSETDLRREWSEPGFKLHSDVLLATRPDGTIAAYVDYNNTREPYVRPFVYCVVDPEIMDSWNWDQLIHWSIERSRKDLDASPADLKFTILAGAALNNVKMLDSWKRAGFHESRRFHHMQIEFEGETPQPTLPEGYEIRSIHRDERRAVYNAMIEAFADHYGFVVPNDQDTGFRRWIHYFFETEGFDPDLMLIAVTADGEIAGGCLSEATHGEDVDMGWINSLAIRREHRKRGLATALVLRSFELFRQSGKKRAGLGVDANSLTNATRLYERCGMHTYKVYVQTEMVLRDGREIANLGE